MKKSDFRPQQNKAVVLLSGGLDSAVTLYLAKKDGFQASCLIFDYGQRHRREIESAMAVAAAAGYPYTVLKISMPWKGSSLLDEKIRLPRNSRTHEFTDSRTIPNTYVPARNIIFLSHAASFAEAGGATAIYIGAHAQDYSGYPDCRPEFYAAFRKVLACGTKAGAENKKIEIKTPLIDKTKAEIIKAGARLGVPFALTWSCYGGGNSPCGSCDSCHYRRKGFTEAGISDPLLKP